MKSTIIISILICFFSIDLNVANVSEIDPDGNKILWSEKRRLTWRDFKGLPPSNRGNKNAETFGKIVTDSMYWDEDIPKFIVNCYFIKDKSWTISDDPLVLEHEQIHFDIYEVHARKIRKSFDSLNATGAVDFSIYRGEFDRIFDENRDYNKKYDNDVKLYRAKQKNWTKKVCAELESLEEFK